ncbi:MAG: ATP-binding cassette domain-containing protein [Pseudomonadota bacterium]|nr:ATP-binding cassette domain-containing protein [Pseudomonadota bacterium]
MQTLRLRGLRRLGLKGIDATLEAGQLACLKGRSGSGKTLLLRAIADLDPIEGTVHLDGQDSSSMPPTEWRRRVAYVPAEPGWWAERVKDHFASDPSDWLSPLNLDPDLLRSNVDELSSGERQRLALVRALVQHPDILLLDEPTANLDNDNTAAVESVVQGRFLTAPGRAVVWVSHDDNQVQRIATRVWVLAGGQLEDRTP